MGYPMTFQRVLNRNRLADGDYENLPRGFVRVNLDPVNVNGFDQSAELAPYWRGQAAAFEQHVKLVCGDLRRLERDAVDEKATCERIAERTGVSADVVAVVLKEFVSW